MRFYLPRFVHPNAFGWTTFQILIYSPIYISRGCGWVHWKGELRSFPKIILNVLKFSWHFFLKFFKKNFLEFFSKIFDCHKYLKPSSESYWFRLSNSLNHKLQEYFFSRKLKLVKVLKNCQSKCIWVEKCR